MIHNGLRHLGWVHCFILLTILAGLFLPASISNAAQTIEVVVEEPVLHPAYSSCSQSYWYPFSNDRTHTAYLTLNTNTPLHSTNYGEWHPVIPQSGYYRVEAYIASHAAITWCTDTKKTIDHDTSEARYSIHHALGITSRSVSQHPLSNQWLNLGEYYFYAGSTGYVSLTDLNSEGEYQTTISFSALRFTYVPSHPPLIYLSPVFHAYPLGVIPPDTGVIKGQGFDVCGLPSIATMQTWWNKSPYKFYGLYLGGSQLPSQCAMADAAWVRAVHKQGWSFIPTWVGPQAPCSGYANVINSDPAQAYQQGRQEALAAASAAAAKGLTNNGISGTIIYYDLEPYGVTTASCREPVKAFMNGWVEKLHELGNSAGGYGSRNSLIFDWSGIAHVPDDIWAAAWYADTYDPYATVFGISWLEGMWVNHQRIRQYGGDDHISWGGIGMVIDSDVADGMVAMPPTGQLAAPMINSSPTVEDTGWLSKDLGWVVSNQRLYWTSDRGKTWTDISPSATRKAFFLPSGQAWALSEMVRGEQAIYTSPDWGTTWERYELSLPEVEWTPIQLQFSSASSGWMVLRKVTSQAFDEGILLKTSNGGQSWQTYPLPGSGEIKFNSSGEGWLVNVERKLGYHTLNGGETWQAIELDNISPAISTLHGGTSHTGGSSGGLSWAATSNGSCQGDKSLPGFTCQVDHQVWQSEDGGTNWESIPLPGGPASIQSPP